MPKPYIGTPKSKPSLVEQNPSQPNWNGKQHQRNKYFRAKPPKKTQSDLQWPDSVLMDKGHGSDGIVVNEQFRVVLERERERERVRERERFVDLVI